MSGNLVAAIEEEYGLRPYQRSMLAEARKRGREGKRRILLVAPTGAGKTRMLAAQMRIASEVAPGCVVYVVHRRQLVEQTHQVLTDLGLKASILMAGYETDWSAKVYVASRDTLWRRRDYVNFGAEGVSLVVFDEAHIGLEAQGRIIELLEPQFVLGYTATPITTAGAGMGSVYEVLVMGPSYMDLIRMGYLVPTRFFAARPMDEELSRLKERGGDYDPASVAEAVRRGELLYDLWEAYSLHAGERTVVFAPTVDLAAHTAERFGAAGIRAAVMDWATPPERRREILRDFAEGRLPIIVNVDVLSEGWDMPLVDTILLASPTKSLARYLQRVGRGMRPAPGKGFLRVIDIVGCYYYHGAPEDIVGWELEPARPPRKGKGAGSSVFKAIPRCPMCKAELKGKRCGQCGHELEAPPYKLKQYLVKKGVLDEPFELDGETFQMVFYLGLLYYARQKGYKDGWAAHAYKERYGEWPKWEWTRMDPIEPVEAVRRWITHLNIRRAKGRPVYASLLRRR